MDRTTFTNYTPSSLIAHAAGQGDASPVENELVRQIWGALGIVFSDLMGTLPEEKDCRTLGPDSRRAVMFNEAVVSIWTRPLTVEMTVHGGGQGMKAAPKTSLGRRVLTARGAGYNPGEWRLAQPGFDAYWTVHVAAGGVERIVLAMLARLAGQANAPLPGVLTDEELAAIGSRYGAIDGNPPVRALLDNGRPLAVLTADLTRSILTTSDGEASATEGGDGRNG